MERRILVATLVALLTTTEGAPGHRNAKALMSCWPNETTKAQCFAGFPNGGGGRTGSMISWLLPSAENDSYVVNGVDIFDSVEFAVTNIEEDPKYLCQYRKQFVQAMQCMADSMKTKCPFLPQAILGTFNAFSNGMTYICSRMHEMDSVCLHTHWGSLRPCSRKVRSELQPTGNHKPGHMPPQSKTAYHSSANHTSSNNATMSEEERTKMSNAACYYRYLVLKCVKQSVESCHGPTAQIMFDFMKNTTSPSCSDKMDAWALAHAGDRFTTAAAPGLAATVMMLLLLLLLPVLEAVMQVLIL